MNQPAIFISCVSHEFRQTRGRVAAILTRLGYTPVIQEILGTEPGDLRQVLRDKIDACKGLIQIVGQGYCRFQLIRRLSRFRAIFFSIKSRLEWCFSAKS